VQRSDVDLGLTLKNFLTWVDWGRSGAASEEHRAHLWEKGVPDMVSAVLRRVFGPEQVGLVGDFLEKIVAAFAMRFSDAGITISGKEYECVEELLNPKNAFFTKYGHEMCTEWRKQMQRGNPGKNENDNDGDEVKADHQDWVDALREGDVAKVFWKEFEQWVPCQIVQVSPTNTEAEVNLFEVADASTIVRTQWVAKDPEIFRPRKKSDVEEAVEPEGEQVAAEEKQEDETISSSSSAASPSPSVALLSEEEMRNHDRHAWRLELEPNHMCDALRVDGEWYQAIVVDMKRDPEGHATKDMLRISFIGVLTSCDEEIARGSLTRLAPLNGKSGGRRGLYFSKVVDEQFADSFVADFDDPKDTYAVLRFSRNSSTSEMLVSLMNVFALNGGFDALRKRLQGPGRRMRLTRLVIALHSRIIQLFTRKYAQSHLPALLDLCWQNFENVEMSEVRQMSKAVVAEMIDGLTRTGYRVLPRKDVCKFAEKLSLLTAEKRLHCPAIMQRIDGMDQLAELIERVENRKHHPYGIELRQSTALSAGNSQPLKSALSSSSKFDKRAAENAMNSVVASKLAHLYDGVQAPSVSTSERSVEKAASSASPQSAVERKEERFEYARVPVTFYLDEDFLAGWILKSGAVEGAVIGSNAHAEMVKHSVKVVQFLSTCERLEQSHLAMFWQAAQAVRGSDNELADAIHEMIAEIIPSLTYKNVIAVLEFVTQNGIESIKTVELLRELCRCWQRVENERAPSLRALDMLWDFVVNSNKKAHGKRTIDQSKHILDEIIRHYASLEVMRAHDKPFVPVAKQGASTAFLYSVLSAAQCVAQSSCVDENGVLVRELLVEKCLDSLKSDHHASGPTLEIFEHLLSSYSPGKELGVVVEDVKEMSQKDHLDGKESREQVIDWLCEKHEVLRLCMSELDRCRKDLVKLAKEEYSKAIFQRLNFVLFLFKESSLGITPESLRLIWNTLIKSSQNPIDQIAAFRFFTCVASRTEASDEHIISGFNIEALRSIFEEKIGNSLCWEMHPQWPDAAFVCFQMWFIEINRAEGLMTRANNCEYEYVTREESVYQFGKIPPLAVVDTPTSMDSYRVEGENLHGQEMLWYLTLESGNVRASKMASMMLGRLNHLRTDSTDSKMGSLIAKCMMELEKSVQASTQNFARNGMRMKRCLRLIIPLLQLTQANASLSCEILKDEAWKRLAPHSATGVGPAIEASVSNNFQGPGKGDKIPVCIMGNDPVWKLRCQVAECLGLDSTDRLRLFAGGKEVKAEFGTTLAKNLQNFGPGISIMACEKSITVSTNSPKTNQSEDEVDGEMPPEENRPPIKSDKEDSARRMLSELPSVLISSNKAYFEILYDLLDVCAANFGHSELANSIAGDTWQLLQALPSDKRMVDPESSLELLRSRETSSLRLLYVVEIVEAKLNPDALPFSRAWIQLFAENGGFVAIEQLVTSLHEKLDGNRMDFMCLKARTCLAKLSRLSFAITCARIVEDDVLMQGLALMPDESALQKIQKEIDLSGTSMIDTGAIFPFKTHPEKVILFIEFLQPLVCAPVASSVWSDILRYDVLGFASEDTLLKILKDLHDEFKLHLLVLCCYALGNWVLSGGTNDQATVMLFVKKGLLQDKGSVQILMRHIFKNALHQGAVANEDFKNELLLTLTHLDPPSEQNLIVNEFFQLCEGLLKACEDGQQYIKNVLIHLRESEHRGDRSGAIAHVDWVLFGHLRMLEEAVKRSGNLNMTDLVDFVMLDCLFTTMKTPLCMNIGTRIAAFSVLATCLKIHPFLWSAKTGAEIRKHISVPIKELAQFVKQREQSMSRNLSVSTSNSASEDTAACWSIDSGADFRAPCGFVGLQNLGFICYMNSLIQQLFMIPRIRYGALRFNAPPAVRESFESDAACETAMERRLMLEELRFMFAALDLSIRQAYNPRGWCAVFKDGSGQPVNIWQQQDAHEFFNTLCDRFDELCKETGNVKLISECLGVTIANQLLCVEPGQEGLQRENASVREYCLTQELGNAEGTNLEESLKKFVEGEVLNDYRWDERDGAKLRTLKRQCIAELSDVLVIHLKRFRLNWETFNTEKINSRFEFPLELNLFPFTKEGLEWFASHSSSETVDYGKRGKEYYHFVLSGVVVHSGASLNSGHYYSYIRSRLGESKGKWFEFNDRIVKPFDIKDLASSTFGGKQNRDNSYYGYMAHSVNNAYMLVYERATKIQDDVDFVGVDAAEYISRDEDLPLKLKESMFVKSAIIPVLEENVTISKMQRLFEPGLVSLFKNVACAFAEAELTDVSDFALDASRFALATLARSTSGRTELPEILIHVGSLLQDGPLEGAQACLKMLKIKQDEENLVQDLLLVQDSDLVRSAAENFIAIVIDAARLETFPEMEETLGSLVIQPLHSGLVREKWNRQSSFWSMVALIAEKSKRANAYLNEKYLIVHIVDTVLGRASPLRDEWVEHPELGPAPNPEHLLAVSASVECDWEEVFRALYFLITSKEVHEDKLTYSTLSVIEFYAESIKLINRLAAVAKSADFVPKYVGRILAHLSKDDEPFSFHALSMITEDMVRANCASLGLYFALLGKLLEVDDSLRESRQRALLVGAVPENISGLATDLLSFGEIAAKRGSEPDCLLEFVRNVIELFLRNKIRVEEDRKESEILPWVAGALERIYPYVAPYPAIEETKEEEEEQEEQEEQEEKVNNGAQEERRTSSDKPELTAKHPQPTISPENTAESSGEDPSSPTVSCTIPRLDYDVVVTMFKDLIDLVTP